MLAAEAAALAAFQHDSDEDDEVLPPQQVRLSQNKAKAWPFNMYSAGRGCISAI